MEIKKIIEDAIPLTPDCEIKRSAEIARRAQLKIRIEELLRERDKSEPFNPKMEYKDGYASVGTPCE